MEFCDVIPTELHTITEKVRAPYSCTLNPKADLDHNLNLMSFLEGDKSHLTKQHFLQY